MDGGNEVLQVLKEIRDEAKETNARLGSLEGRVEQTNVALGSLEGRVEETNVRLQSLENRTEFLERRVTAGFEKLSGEISAVAQRLVDTEIRLATEVVGLAHVTGEVRDLLAHADLRNLATRVRALEDQLSGRGK